jgi:hypothetical protein
MGLIDLKTDLKSLKYGNDRLGGGDSGQPFIQTNINTVNSGFNRLRLTNFDDGLILANKKYHIVINQEKQKWQELLKKVDELVVTHQTTTIKQWILELTREK